MAEYLAPGVFYERADAAAGGVAPLRTDITGFVGIAERGPLHAPVPVDSWRQFEAWFGSFSPVAYLAYAVRAFFENGGRRCWVVRVAADGAAAAAAPLGAPGAPVRWWLRAGSPGAWGDRLDATLRETQRAQTRSVAGAGSDPAATAVQGTAGFERGTHVRVAQPGRPVQHKVVAGVDPVARRIAWLSDAASQRLRHEAPLAGFDPAQPLTITSIEYTLIVREAGVLRLVLADLSLVPEHPRYGPALLAGVVLAPAGGPAPSLPPAPPPVQIVEAAPDALDSDAAMRPLSGDGGLTEWTVRLAGGADGLAALGADDFCGAPDPALDDRPRRGLAALAAVDEVALLAVPDIHIQAVDAATAPPGLPAEVNPCLAPAPAPATPRERPAGERPPRFAEHDVHRVQAAMVAQCERRRDRIALLDAPFAAANDARQGIAAVRAWRSRFDSSYAALYHPWLRVVDPLRSGGALVRAVPPCGHVAGVCARGDLAVGVHQAPANAALAWAQQPTATIDEAAQGLLNPLGINAIRTFPGRGVRVYGARTLASDGALRHLNVRRLLAMIGKAVELSLQWALFEPDDEQTRAKVRLVLGDFLFGLWSRGALAGAVADEAFFVRCDAALNPPAQREQGRLLALVGVAPSRPLEFVLVRVGRWANGFEVNADGASALAGG